jgi:hypothetical protein
MLLTRRHYDDRSIFSGKQPLLILRRENGNTPCGRNSLLLAILEKLSVVQLLEEIATFNGIGRFITVSTRANEN